MSGRKIAPKYWACFADNAAPEAIAVYLAAANTERRSLDRYIAKLETLLETRTAELAAGTWPVVEGE